MQSRMLGVCWTQAEAAAWAKSAAASRGWHGACAGSRTSVGGGRALALFVLVAVARLLPLILAALLCGARDGQQRWRKHGAVMWARRATQPRRQLSSGQPRSHASRQAGAPCVVASMYASVSSITILTRSGTADHCSAVASARARVRMPPSVSSRLPLTCGATACGAGQLAGVAGAGEGARSAPQLAALRA